MWAAFLTDYGRRDGFVAACHGVMARIAPRLRVIDVTHDVPAQDVRHGAVVLAQTVPYLPACVVVGVVDPGVGSARRGVAISAGGYTFVGPDNGLLSWAAETVAQGSVERAVELTEPAYRLAGDRAGGVASGVVVDAATFHGRDVFAPAAAHIARGVALSELGPRVDVDTLVRLPEPEVRAGTGFLHSEAHVVDHFGNVSLAARSGHFAAAGFGPGERVRVSAGDGPETRARVGRVFADVEPGGLLVYVDSHDYVAVAVNQGDAAALLGVRPGDEISIDAG
ncbi:hypothetical protein EF847_04795 [Actinobacteria bacterium YIM 96077]|uniref:SAM-dependent chlorinase/fluorinase n=2 Tax=Phytoactinopolyspora halophila TaxID=1981511 RepID=A0A329R2Z3_9ACTN|nr:hypothetical protein EF847_04795 [Actinobacteria bacterium YIM 96077]RAW18947.1 hypothetical protein DPM12_00720 [Phytoactinopolyspora halophila]